MRNYMDLTGRGAFVTGASSGLGYEYCKALAENGARVAGFARRLERLEGLQKEIEAAGGTFLPVQCDVSKEDQVAAGFVSNGFGICVAPNIPILQSLNVKILPLVSPSWQRNFYMAMLKNVYHPPVVEAFKKYVIEQAQKEWDYKTS